MRLQGRSSNVWKSLNATNLQQKKETEFRNEKQIKNRETMKKDLLPIKLKLDNPATRPIENYAVKKVQLTPEVEQHRTVILATYCSSGQIGDPEIVSKSK